jgi:hypothetical protein
MIANESKSKSKTKNKKASRRTTSKKAVARASKEAARGIPRRTAAGSPLEFVRSEPSVTIYEVVETEVYGESNSEVDNQGEEFGT